MVLERFKIVDDYVISLGVLRDGNYIYFKVVTKYNEVFTHSYSLSDNNLIKIVDELLNTTNLVSKDDIKFMITTALSRSDVRPGEIEFFMSQLS